MRRFPSVRHLFDASARLFRSSPTPRKRSRQLHLEALEDRTTPVVGAFDFPAIPAASSFYNGVVQITAAGGVSGSGALLPSGRHILTAAHVVDANGDGAVDVGSYEVNFDLAGGRVPVGNLTNSTQVAITNANVSIPQGWNGKASEGRDIAIITLPSIAPYGAQRYYRYGGQVDDQVMEIVGYGRTNYTRPNGGGEQGDKGADPGNFGKRRVGYNIVDGIIKRGGNTAQHGYINYELDIQSLDRAPFQQEAIQAKGDSGGPLFINGLIAGVISHSENWVSPWDDEGFATHVSPFGGWIDSFVDPAYDLVLDMNTQPGGNDGAPDKVEILVLSNGVDLIVRVNGNQVHSDSVAKARSITLRGSRDNEEFIVGPGLNQRVTVQGGAGTNALTVFDWNHPASGATTYTVNSGQVTRTGGLTVAHTGIGSVNVHTGRGTNQVTVNAPNTTITTGPEVNYVTLNSPDGTVNAERGNNTITLNGLRGKVTAGFGTNDITVKAANATLTTGPGTSYILIAAPNTTVNGGAGNDYVRLSYGVSLADMLTGTVTVKGGGGYNSLSLDDSSNSDSLLLRRSLPTFTITDTAVTRVNDYWDANVGRRTLTTKVNYSGMNYISVGGGSTSDTFLVQSTPAATAFQISGAAGNDVVTLGGPSGLDRVRSSLTLTGGLDFDRLFLDDRGGTTTHDWTTYDVTDKLVRADGREISFGSGFQEIVLETSNGPDQISVAGTAAGVPLRINAGGGKDTIGVLFQSIGNLLRSPVHVEGGDDADDIWVRDETGGPKNYTLWAGKVEQFGVSPVTYGTVETVTAVGGVDSDNYQVRGTAAGVTTNLYGWSGADSFNVWNEASTLDDLPGPLNLYGDPIWSLDQDNVYLSDYGNAAGQDYTLTADTLSRPGVGSIHFEQMAHVALWMGEGNDRVRVQAAGVPAAYLLDGGAGRDTLDYSAYADNVTVDLSSATATDVRDGVPNFENVLGGAGHDMLIGDAGNNVLVGGPGINRLDGGAGQDVLIAGSGRGNLTGGPGDDVLIAGSTAYDLDPVALDAMMAEWSRTDPEATYAVRVAHLRDGQPGAPALHRATFTANGGTDRLTGGDDLDLIFGARARDIHDWVEGSDEVFVAAEVLERTTRIDARSLGAATLYVDGVELDATRPIEIELQPGLHYLYTSGYAITWFTVADDGTLDYDTALEGALTGRGTSSLAVNGRAVTLDASALGETTLTIDNISYDAASPFTATLLPGEHWVYASNHGYLYFTVAGDGTLDYDAVLDGILSGRGTSTLGFLSV